MVIVSNMMPIGAFANKDSGIKENCNPGDIVLELDADDYLIGRQVFKTINAIYQQNKSWLAYSNFLIYHPDQKVTPGISRKLRVEPKLYRKAGTYWATSHLKTYYAALEMKIPISNLAIDG